MNSGEPLLDAAQHLLMPVNFQVGMQAALHQHSGTTHFDGLANLFVNGFELEDVSLFGFGTLQWTIEGTEGAIFGAEICVVNVAINDIRRHALGMELAAHRISFHADTDEVIGVKQVESLRLRQGHGRSGTR